MKTFSEFLAELDVTTLKSYVAKRQAQPYDPKKGLTPTVGTWRAMRKISQKVFPKK